jgi:hypothetical protein
MSQTFDSGGVLLILWHYDARCGFDVWSIYQGETCPARTRGHVSPTLNVRRIFNGGCTRHVSSRRFEREHRQIARALTISQGTAKNHVENLLAKLGVSDRTEAVVRALEMGILGLRPDGTPLAVPHSVLTAQKMCRLADAWLCPHVHHERRETVRNFDGPTRRAIGP